jgi:peptide deformylase
MKKISIVTAILLITMAIINSCGSLSVANSEDNSGTGFSPAQAYLIKGKQINTPMKVLQSDNMEDSLFLRSISSPVDPMADKKLILALISRMLATVTDSLTGGVGIAAPQVGISKRVILVQRFDKDGEPFEAYLNPTISQYSKTKQDCREGCLSVPGIRGTTTNRSFAVYVEYNDMDNNQKGELIEGYTAVIFQHEIDHLNGILFFDHLK